MSGSRLILFFTLLMKSMFLAKLSGVVTYKIIQQTLYRVKSAILPDDISLSTLSFGALATVERFELSENAGVKILCLTAWLHRYKPNLQYVQNSPERS